MSTEEFLLTSNLMCLVRETCSCSQNFGCVLFFPPFSCPGSPPPPPLFLALMDIFTHLNGDWWLIDCDDALLPTPSTSFFGLTNVLMLMCVVFQIYLNLCTCVNVGS